MQIAIIKTEAPDFVKINICDILKTFGHDFTSFLLMRNSLCFLISHKKEVYLCEMLT